MFYSCGLQGQAEITPMRSLWGHRGHPLLLNIIQPWSQSSGQVNSTRCVNLGAASLYDSDQNNPVKLLSFITLVTIRSMWGVGGSRGTSLNWNTSPTPLILISRRGNDIKLVILEARLDWPGVLVGCRLKSYQFKSIKLCSTASRIVPWDAAWNPSFTPSHTINHISSQCGSSQDQKGKTC